MRLSRCWLALFALPALLSFLPADEPPKADGPIKWKKIVVEPVFRSEGVAVADVNKDGKLDILIGDYWYENPSWEKHEIRKPVNIKDKGLGSYSECMCCWADDINKDGWPDQIVIGFPGKPAYWYENPQGKDGHWKEHMIWHSACNETPTYVDLFGTGKKVLVMGWQTKGKEDQGQMAWFAPGKDPTALWEMHPISEPSAPGKEIPGTRRFSHGLGIGDVNGDGRLDVICTGGWWEQPAKVSDEPWKFHPANLGEACADMFAYDIDGDGKADIISSSAHKFGIWSYRQKPGKDHPNFVKVDLFPQLVSETHSMWCVDLDGDGLKDLVTGKRFWSHGKNEPGSDKPAYLYWFQAKKSSDGTISFIPHVIDEDSGVGTQFQVIDFDGDGKLDIVTSNKKGTFVHLQVK
ncbi:MAG TPA: VCBS repeat-containing protein [Gemmataceae bacterium]|nr:VCBS repeat-containing protein [Gemmataceae bacterium]